MTLEEKLNITQQSISNAPVGAVERLGYPGLFYADGSEGIRGAPFASSTPQALTGEPFRDGQSDSRLMASCRELGQGLVVPPRKDYWPRGADQRHHDPIWPRGQPHEDASSGAGIRMWARDTLAQMGLG